MAGFSPCRITFIFEAAANRWSQGLVRYEARRDTSGTPAKCETRRVRASRLQPRPPFRPFPFARAQNSGEYGPRWHGSYCSILTGTRRGEALRSSCASAPQSARQLMTMFGVVTLYPTDEGALPVDRRALRVLASPALEFGMQGMQVPSRALSAQEIDGLVGHEPARRRV